MEYKLSKSSEKDINRLIEYKNRTIYQYAKDLSNEEIDRINKYVTSEVPRLINDYCNIIVDNKIVGCILLTNNDNGKLLDEIYLEEEYRNKGIAQELLDKIKTKDIFLEVRESNQVAINFYKKNKFKEISVRKNYYSEPNENAIIMKLEVNNEQ